MWCRIPTTSCVTSVQFSCSVVSDSLQPHSNQINYQQDSPTSVQFSSVTQSCLTLWPHGLQHARLPYLSPTPRTYSNSCPLSRWCHPTISSSVVPFSSHLRSFPTSGSFQTSQLFKSGGQSIGVSASASVLPMNIQDWSPLGWTGLISLLSKGLSRVFSSTTVQKPSHNRPSQTLTEWINKWMKGQIAF